MTEKDINYVCRLLEKYCIIANRPNDDNNIEINGNIISIKEKGNEIYNRMLNVDSIREKLENTPYVKNIFSNVDSIYSPFEADRKENRYIWTAYYNNISFPSFISVLLFSLLATGEIPSIVEFCAIYLSTYTEVIDVKYSNPSRNILYTLSNVEDRVRVGKEIVFGDIKIKNNLLRFKGKFTEYLKDFPINEFTTEHICSRIYKAYGSIVRDIFNVLYFDKLGEKSYYNFLDDLSGIDLMLNDIPIFAYTDTKASQEFRQRKRDERHPELSKTGVALESLIGEKKKGKVYLIDECTAKKIIEATKYLRDNNVKRIIKITF